MERKQQLVIGNWKMHGGLIENWRRLEALAGSADQVSARLAVCVPYPYLAQTARVLDGSRVGCGAQNVSQFESGAYTGEVAAAMLGEFGCTYVLVGHSERRALFGEDDATVAAKFVACQRHGLTPVLCVGETLAEREAGQTMAVVARQLAAVAAVAGSAALAKAVIAYEPVWAIGTGRTASPEEAQEVHAHLSRCLTMTAPRAAEGVPILYGGSVKAANAAQLFAMRDIDGGLVGGASLQADEFLAIGAAARHGTAFNRSSPLAHRRSVRL